MGRPSAWEARSLAGVLAMIVGVLPAPASSQDAGDPWEGMNRRVFQFNEQLDRYVLEPVGIAWDWALPDRVQNSVANLFDHLRFPVHFANDLLQAKPVAAVEDLGRFVTNTLVGAGGLFDPASAGGLPGHNEDFGQTLGTWGVPTGPYLVLPILGPSSPRATAGLAIDSMSHAHAWFVPFYVNIATNVTQVVNRRSLVIDELREERHQAFDFYVAVRNAYIQYRGNQVLDRTGEPDEARDDDLYYDEDEDGE